MRTRYLPVWVALLFCCDIRAADGQSWSLSGDWNGVSNPNGVWTYGDRGGGTFVSLGTGDGSQYGNQEFFKNEGTQAGYGIDPGQISMHADTASPDARFTAPFAGTYTIDVAIGGTTVYENGGYGNADAANAELFVNGSTVAGNYDASDNVYSWNLEEPLSAGGTVDAYLPVNYGAGNTQAIFDVSVPEPSAAAGLVLAGAVAIFLPRRAHRLCRHIDL